MKASWLLKRYVNPPERWGALACIKFFAWIDHRRLARPSVTRQTLMTQSKSMIITCCVVFTLGVALLSSTHRVWQVRAVIYRLFCVVLTVLLLTSSTDGKKKKKKDKDLVREKTKIWSARSRYTSKKTFPCVNIGGARSSWSNSHLTGNARHLSQ